MKAEQIMGVLALSFVNAPLLNRPVFLHPRPARIATHSAYLFRHVIIPSDAGVRTEASSLKHFIWPDLIASKDAFH